MWAEHPRHYDALRSLGVESIDYADINNTFIRIHELAPEGVDAVFDNIGGETLKRSWRALAPGGTLVSYAIVSVVQSGGSIGPSFIALLAGSVNLFWIERQQAVKVFLDRC